MKTKPAGIALFILTLGAVVFYPQFRAMQLPPDPPVRQHPLAGQQPIIDLVFVLDTTGSMSGLIETAKEKIWSIATTMASAQHTPEIRIGLVAYRDRGDQYVTRIVDLSDDLDSVYAQLMDFEAAGGGDMPESVNQALYEAVHQMSWSAAVNAYQVIFLVGDAPPHMDYHETRYPEIVASANDKGIVINTIQSGDMAETLGPWTQIANLGQGSFFQVEQSGSAVAWASPFDAEIAELSARLDQSRLHFGTTEQQERMALKMGLTDKFESGASIESRARRGVFNVSAGGRSNLLGENELVDAIATGSIALEDLDADSLPEKLKAMAPAEQAAHVSKLAAERKEITQQIQVLAAERDDYIAAKVDEAGGMHDSLDRQIYEAVREQAGKVGLDYRDGPAY